MENVFGNRFTDLRKDKRLTQRDFAKIFDITQATVCRWETGEREPDFDTLLELCRFFDVSADYLIGLEDEGGAKITAPALSAILPIANNNDGTSLPNVQHWEKPTPKVYGNVAARDGNPPDMSRATADAANAAAMLDKLADKGQKK